MFLIVPATIANIVLSSKAYLRMPWTWTTALRTGLSIGSISILTAYVVTFRVSLAFVFSI
jgi:hypothetical protein